MVLSLRLNQLSLSIGLVDVSWICFNLMWDIIFLNFCSNFIFLENRVSCNGKFLYHRCCKSDRWVNALQIPAKVNLLIFFFKDHTHVISLTVSCDGESCEKRQICEYIGSGNYNCTCTPGYYGDDCEGIVTSDFSAHSYSPQAIRQEHGTEEEQGRQHYPTGIWTTAWGRLCSRDGWA